MDSKPLYVKQLAERLGARPEEVFLTWKGRVAFYAILEAMGVGEGDEVILPAFTCVVVPNAIVYLGAKPVYVDIERETLNPSFTSISDAVTSKTKVIVCQNTFGLSSDLERVAKFAKEKEIYTIEDCTHGFGGLHSGQPNGAFCDAAFYSTQWNKPFSTGIGGIGWVRNEAIRKCLKVDSYAKPGWTSRVILSLLLFIRKNIVKPWNYWAAVKLYRWLSMNNIVLGSSSGGEVAGVNRPQGYKCLSCSIQHKEGIKALKKLDNLLERRKSNAALLTAVLKKLDKYYVLPELHADHSFLKYPILVKDREKMEKLAIRNKLELGDWFNSQLHPVQEDFHLWSLETDRYPVSMELSRQVLNIPCDTAHIGSYVQFIESFSEELLK